MAAIIWPDYSPGSTLGPCKEPCSHTDCAETRQLAWHLPGHPICSGCGTAVEAGEGAFLGPEQATTHVRCTGLYGD